ncbi:ThuA domain-containing protein [Isoptericola sp. NPDC060282]|uniref:ThuA domain-containing protein n=1 Tax=Isoptericola sp. NPDC060282 TaxID=3347093 RepID=UPI0036512548
MNVTVIVAGTDTHHDLYAAAGALRDIVAEGGLPVQVAVGLRRFVDPMPVTAETDVFVVYTAGSDLPADEQDALRDLVASGRGLVAVHASSVVLDGEQDAWSRLIGCRYASHDPSGLSEGRIAVRVGEHPITTALDDFEVEDEYYVTTVAADADVVAEHRLTDGRWVPALVTRTEGEGRVVCTTLGHDGRAWFNPWFRQLLRQAVVWAGGADPAAETRTWSTRFPLGNGRHVVAPGSGGAS